MLQADAPDGTRWRVARRVLPWRPRLRRDPGDLDPAGIVLQLLSLPLLVIELALAALVQLARIALRRPWRVEAVSTGPPPQRLVWSIAGFGAAKEHARAVAASLEQSGRPTSPPDERHVG